MSHGLRSSVEKMGCAGKRLLTGEFEVDFVHKCGGLKGLTWWQLAEAMGGEGAKVFVDLFDQVCGVVFWGGVMGIGKNPS